LLFFTQQIVSYVYSLNLLFRWREELAKQIKEKEKIKETTPKETNDSDMWSRHFETMLPIPNNKYVH